MTLGLKWAYNPHDVYKTTKTVVQTLVCVVATGGSLLLDVGPMPTGELPPVALQRLAETGEWMQVNSESIYDTTPQSPYATSVTGTTTPGGQPDKKEWGLISPAAHGISAGCGQSSAGNPPLKLDACKAKCAATTGCNTINFAGPDTCILKECTNPGEPLVTKDGGYDVWCLGCANATSSDWRLTRKADTVYATLLLTNDTLPETASLSLPFAVGVPGGVDGTWPHNNLRAVTLLGAGAVPFRWTAVAGLLLTVEPGTKAAAPYAAVFKLDYSAQ